MNSSTHSSRRSFFRLLGTAILGLPALTTTAMASSAATVPPPGARKSVPEFTPHWMRLVWKTDSTKHIQYMVSVDRNQYAHGLVGYLVIRHLPPRQCGEQCLSVCYDTPSTRYLVVGLCPDGMTEPIPHTVTAA